MSGGSGTGETAAQILSRVHPTAIRGAGASVTWPKGKYSAAVMSICAQHKLLPMSMSGVITLVPEDEAKQSVVVPSGARQPAELVAAFTSAGAGLLQAAPLPDAVVLTYPYGSEDRVRAIVKALEVMCFDVEVMICVADKAASRALQVALSGNAGGKLGTGGVSSFDALLSAVGIARGGRSFARSVQTSQIPLCDGNEGVLNAGSAFGIAQRTVSPQGTVTITGYTQVTTGLELSLILRRVNNAALLDCNISLSSVDAIVENYPQTSQRRVRVVCPIEQDRYICVGSLSDVHYEETQDGIISLGSAKSGKRADVLILARITTPSPLPERSDRTPPEPWRVPMATPTAPTGTVLDSPSLR